jgi:hypothetical protein
MPLTGSSGFDLYLNDGGKSTYYKTFMPITGTSLAFENVIYFNDV